MLYLPGNNDTFMDICEVTVFSPSPLVFPKASWKPTGKQISGESGDFPFLPHIQYEFMLNLILVWFAPPVQEHWQCSSNTGKQNCYDRVQNNSHSKELS